MKLKEEILTKGLVEKYFPQNRWRTGNDKIHTILFTGPYENTPIARKDITLQNNEKPILECSLPNGNYLLITTENIFSEYRKVLIRKENELLIGIDPITSIFNENKLNNPTALYILRYKDGYSIFYEIDSQIPSQVSIQVIIGILDNWDVFIH